MRRSSVSSYYLTIFNFLKQPLIKSMIVVASISIFIKASGFYKETVIAASFGLSELLDTFLIAMLIPAFVQNVFINALSNLFVPNYIAELKTTSQKKQFQSVIFLMVISLALFLTVVCLLFSTYFLEILYPNHTDSYYHLIRVQLYWILPCLTLWAFSSVLSSLLEVKGRFFYSSFSPIFGTIATIICLVFFKDSLREIVLAVGMLIGSILSFFYQLIVCLLHNEIELGKPVLSENMRTMIRQMPPKVASGFLTGSNSFVDQFFAAQLAAGSLAALSYGAKIPAFAVGMLILPLGRVLLPHFSRTINDDLLKAYHQLFRILKWVAICTAVVAFIGICYSQDIVRVLFERKEFDSADTTIVANIQKIGLIYIPFYLSTLICVKFLTAVNKNKFMAWTSFWNLGVNLVLNYVFVKYFGVYGLAFSTTIVYIISSIIYVGFTYRQYSKLSNHVQI